MQNQLAREAERLDGFYGLFKIQDESESYEGHRGRKVEVRRFDIWGFYKPDGSKDRRRFREVDKAAEARDDAYHEYYKDSEANWHTYNFINWNFPWGEEDEKCEPYYEYLKTMAKEQRQKGVEWLNSTRWGLKWLMKNVDAGEIDFY